MKGHHEAVQRYFAARPGDIIQFDVTSGDGWSRLRAFVGRPAPNVPFPKLRTPYISPFEFVKRDELARKQVLLRQFLAGKGGDEL
jgi:sulfotransferase family protein